MPQSLVQIYLHLVFSTKNRAPFLRDPSFRERVHAYLVGICKNQHCPSLRVGGRRTTFISSAAFENARCLDAYSRIETRLLQMDQRGKSTSGRLPLAKRLRRFSVSPSHVEALIRIHRQPRRTSSTRNIPGRVPVGCARNTASKSMNGMFGIKRTARANANGVPRQSPGLPSLSKGTPGSTNHPINIEPQRGSTNEPCRPIWSQNGSVENLDM